MKSHSFAPRAARVCVQRRPATAPRLNCNVVCTLRVHTLCLCFEATANGAMRSRRSSIPLQRTKAPRLIRVSNPQ
eukprot:2176003-Rhodomonas_salina.1